MYLQLVRTVLPIAVAGLAGLLYLNALRGGFVWDDIPLIAENPALRTLKNLPKALISDFSGLADPSRRSGYYRPVTVITYFLDYHLWRGWPFGFHLSNLLFHALCSLLIYLLSLKALGSREVASAAGFLFAAHPVHTEAVAWISGRTDVLAALFLLAALLAMDRTYGLSLALSALSMGAKESGTSVVLLAPLYGMLHLGKAPRRYIWYALVGAGFWTLRWSVVGGVRLPPETPIPPIPLRVAEVPLLWGRYIWKLIWPLQLNAEWEVPAPVSLGFQHLVGWGILACGTYYLLRRWRKHLSIVFGLGFLFLGLLPVSGVVPLYDRTAERFLYLPSAGFALLTAWGWAFILRWRRALAWALLSGVVLAYSWTTVSRNRVWKDQETLFWATVRDAPHSARAHYNLGTYLLGKGNYDEAISLLRKALSLRPGFREAQYNLACAYALKGDTDRAIRALWRAVRMGVRDGNYIASDPDLKTLHSDPRFRTLLRALGVAGPPPGPFGPRRSP